MDNTILLIVGVLLVVVVVGAVFWMKKANSADDIKRIEPKAQEGSKSSASASKVKANTAKTAQLEALRDRLSDGKTSTPVKKVIAKKPADGGQAAVPKATAAPVSVQEEGWSPEAAEEGGSSPSSVNKFLLQKEPDASQARSPIKNDVLGAVAEIAPVQQQQVPSVAKTVVGSDSGSKAPVAGVPEIGSVKNAKPLILLVDDSKVIRVKTEKLLTAAGYEVALAIDGMDALSKLGSIRPQAIITDIEMPNLDGFGLVRSVKGNLQTSEIPIIVMTSHVNLHLDIAATEGINGFLPKPFNDQDLLDQVSYLVNG